MKQLPYSVGLGGFLLERGKDVSNLLKRLHSKRKGKVSFNNVNKRLRRRAMSHNRYRIPARLRSRIEGLLIEKQKGQKVATCRRSMRKSRLLALEYMRRQKNGRWLATHVWMSKRMHMAEYFGVKVAQKSQQKGWRAAWRHSQHHAVMSDFSYWSIYKANLQDCEQAGWHLHQVALGKSYLRASDISLQCLVLALASDKEVVLAIHPADTAFLESKVVLQKIERYSLILTVGPASLSKVNSLIKGNPPWAKIEDPMLLPNHAFSFDIDPQDQKMVFPPSKLDQTELATELTSTGLDLTVNLTEPYQWWRVKPKQLVRLKVSTRARYNHRRVSARHKEKSGRKSNSTEKEPGGKKSLGQYKEQPSRNIFVADLQPAEEAQIHKCVLLPIQFKNTPAAMIVVQDKNALWVWRRLVYSGCHPVGLKQLKYIFNASGEPLYPEDFIFSGGHKVVEQKLTDLAVQKYKRLPPNKRVNYFAINSPFPFHMAFDKISRGRSLVQVVVKCLTGLPRRCAYLCRLNQGDFKLARQALQSGSRFVLEEEAANDNEQIDGLDKDQLLKTLGKIKTTRQIIGMVTDGFFSMRQQRGVGMGWAVASEAEEFILLRNSQSRHYHLAELRPIAE